jgi:hypothetical protein
MKIRILLSDLRRFLLPHSNPEANIKKIILFSNDIACRAVVVPKNIEAPKIKMHGKSQVQLTK